MSQTPLEQLAAAHTAETPQRPYINPLLENVAAVACGLQEVLNRTAEHLFPGAYYYHAFDGFPGFWIFAAEAGRIFSEVDEATPDGIQFDYPEGIDKYTESVMQEVIDRQRLIFDDELRTLAQEAIAAASHRN
jgi:predicted amidohydrolase